MPVGLYPGPNSYTAGAGAMVFPYSFRILNKTHLLVQVNDVTKVVDSDYTVSGVGNSTGGNITFLTPMVGGETVLISRNVPYKRDTDYQANGDFREDTVDSDFDLEEMQTQQLAAAIVRALKAPLSITADQVFSEADWAARASKFVTFDGAGALTLSSVFAPGALTVSAFIQTLLDDADAATARGTLKGSIISRAANTILGVADIGNVIRATAGYTQTFSAAATLGNGWWVPYRVEAGATIVFDPNAAELIDGVATKTIVGPNSGIIYCDGAALYTIGFDGIARSLIDAAGDLIVGTANDTAGKLTMGTALQRLRVNAGATALEWTAPTPILATPVASTSGTSIDFTGIPSGTKRITLLLKDVSTNGTSNLLVQIGPSGAPETSGYVGIVSNRSTDTGGTTAGIQITNSQDAANLNHGVVILTLENAAAFTMISVSMCSAGGTQCNATFSKSTASEMSRIRLTTVNGTDTFDAGEVNIVYE